MYARVTIILVEIQNISITLDSSLSLSHFRDLALNGALLGEALTS